MARETSRTAWEEYQDSEARGKAIKTAISTLVKNGPMTGQEMSNAAGHPGLWKRLSEMERMGFVETKGKRRCGVTHKTAMVWALT